MPSVLFLCPAIFLCLPHNGPCSCFYLFFFFLLNAALISSYLSLAGDVSHPVMSGSWRWWQTLVLLGSYFFLKCFWELSEAVQGSEAATAPAGVRHDARSSHLYLLLSFLLLDVDMSQVIRLMCTCVCLHLLCVSYDQGHMCPYSLCLIWSAHLCMHVSKLSQVPYD